MWKFFFISIMITVSFSCDAQTKPAKPSSGEGDMGRGKIIYEKTCLVCHQSKGEGVYRMNPPLIKTPWVLGEKTRLISIVLMGLDEEIEVNGEVYFNPMPAQADLTDQEVADVLTFVRNSFGNKASAVNAAEVKAVRAKIKK
jgi:mono/diheme cytochrome c family protein